MNRRRWYKKNGKRIREYSKGYRKKNRLHMCAYQMMWAKKRKTWFYKLKRFLIKLLQGRSKITPKKAYVDNSNSAHTSN